MFMILEGRSIVALPGFIMNVIIMNIIFFTITSVLPTVCMPRVLNNAVKRHIMP